MIPLTIESGSGPRRIDLLTYLEPEQEERAQADAYAWIKAVRRMRVDGQSFRTRFTVRGDSLWWFAELFLHKEQAIFNVHRILAAFDAMVERERPLEASGAADRFAGVIAQAAAARAVRYRGPSSSKAWRPSWLRTDARATGLALAARLSRLRS